MSAKAITIGKWLYIEHRESFGQRLRRIRKEKGYSQVQLADKIGVPSHYICDYEKERFHPNLAMLEWLCEALDITATELLGF